MYMLSIRDPLQTQGHTQVESVGLEKYISCKQKSKESKNSNIESKRKQKQQYSYQTKQTLKQDCYKRQRGTLQNDKGSIQEEYIAIVNIYAPNIGASQYLKQILTAIKGEIGSNTIIAGDFNTSLSSLDRSVRQKIIRKHRPYITR